MNLIILMIIIPPMISIPLNELAHRKWEMRVLGRRMEGYWLDHLQIALVLIVANIWGVALACAHYAHEKRREVK